MFLIGTQVTMSLDDYVNSRIGRLVIITLKPSKDATLSEGSAPQPMAMTLIPVDK